MSKGFWMALALVFGVAFSSLSLYVYSKDILLKVNREYASDDFLSPEEDCLTKNN